MISYHITLYYTILYHLLISTSDLISSHLLLSSFRLISSYLLLSSNSSLPSSSSSSSWLLSSSHCLLFIFFSSLLFSSLLFSSLLFSPLLFPSLTLLFSSHHLLFSSLVFSYLFAADELTFFTPLPVILKVDPGWVPGLIFITTVPSNVRTSAVDPRTACWNLI